MATSNLQRVVVVIHMCPTTITHIVNVVSLVKHNDTLFLKLAGNLHGSHGKTAVFPHFV